MSEVEPLEEAPAGGYKVSLPTFEGPLDLLLHLCQKHELDILDIPIAFVTEKYLEYLAVMQLLDLDLASEYLVMAATLAHIKSKQLLPAPPPGQEDDAAAGEEEDPREALIRRLLEYQKYKQAAADLVARGIAGADVFLRGMKLEEVVETGLPPLAQVPLFSLVEAFQGVLERSKVKLSHDIVHERMTLTDRINELVDLLRVKKRAQFEELFEGMTTRFDLVITFLALLEMTKLRMTRLFQEHPLAPIFVEFAAQVTGDEDPSTLFDTAQITSDVAAPPVEKAGEGAAAGEAAASEALASDAGASAVEAIAEDGAHPTEHAPPFEGESAADALGPAPGEESLADIARLAELERDELARELGLPRDTEAPGEAVGTAAAGPAGEGDATEDTTGGAFDTLAPEPTSTDTDMPPASPNDDRDAMRSSDDRDPNDTEVPPPFEAPGEDAEDDRDQT